MSARTAWAEGALVDGMDTGWLASSERSRPKARLLGHAEEVATFPRWLSSRQVGTERYRLADSDFGELLQENGVVATGISAAHAHGARLSAAGEAEAYVNTAVGKRLTRKFFLVASERGNLLLRTVNGAWHADTATWAGSASSASNEAATPLVCRPGWPQPGSGVTFLIRRVETFLEDDMAGTTGSAFWEDLAADLEDPEFLRGYVVESMRIATIDRLVNELDAARAAAGLSKAELARAIGAEPASIRRLFAQGHSNPTLGTLAEVASALGMRVTLTPLPAAERKTVTTPLLEGRSADPRALVEHLVAARGGRELAASAQ